MSLIIRRALPSPLVTQYFFLPICAFTLSQFVFSFFQDKFLYNAPIFWKIGLKFIMESQETIIYRYVKRNPIDDAYFPFLIFWVIFGVKMDVATMRAPCTCGQGPPNPTKKVGPFGSTIISNFLGVNYCFPNLCIYWLGLQTISRMFLVL